MRNAILAAVTAVVLVQPTALAGTAVQLEVEGLAAEADLAFEGRVLTARALTTPTGRIETEYLVSVRRTWWGAPEGTRLFRLPGGTLPNGSGLVLAGMPPVEVGMDAIFFLSSEGASGVRMPVGLAQGVMSVVTDSGGYQALVRSQSGLTLVEPSTGRLIQADPRAVLDYRETVERIESATSLRRSAEFAEGR